MDSSSPALKPLRAALIASGDPHDIGLWSGIPFHMLQVLKKRFDIVLVVGRPWAWWFRPVGRTLKVLTRGRFRYMASHALTRAAAGGTIGRLRSARPDVVLAVSVTPLAYALVGEFRVVHIADATTRSMAGYYEAPIWSSRTASADAMEATLIRGALLSLYPSRWALDSALHDYGAPRERALEIAWGSNIAMSVTSARNLPDGPLRLLFVGVEWERKGGPLALAVAAALTARGVACRLDIVGVAADVLRGGSVPSNVRFHGFLAKADPAQAATLATLYQDATFFLLPTRAECFGIVFAEAASRGLPSISFATGGVPSAVRNDVTGVLFPIEADAEEFAAAIDDIVSVPGRYTAMSQAALDDARERLNWDAWAVASEAAIRTTLARDGHAASSSATSDSAA